MVEDISAMVGQVFDTVVQDGYEMVFSNKEMTVRFWHYQDCCESVSIEDICGDLEDLVGSPILLAEESSGDVPEGFVEPEYSSCTWTFYKFATIKGYVDVRWFGESNGYYSESVETEIIRK